MIIGTDMHLDTIRRARYNATAREIAAHGISLSHEQADEIGDVGCDWLRTRLGLTIETTARGVLASAGRRCECGQATGEPCPEVLDTAAGGSGVTVYYMPEFLRESHRAAGNSGVYPLNGSLRLYVSQDCQARLEAEAEASS